MSLTQWLYPTDANIQAYASTGWYVSAVLPLYFISPILKKCIDNFEEKGGIFYNFILWIILYVMELTILSHYFNTALYMTPFFRATEFMGGMLIADFLLQKKYIVTKNSFVISIIVWILMLLMTRSFNELGPKQMLTTAPFIMLVIMNIFSISTNTNHRRDSYRDFTICGDHKALRFQGFYILVHCLKKLIITISKYSMWVFLLQYTILRYQKKYELQYPAVSGLEIIVRLIFWFAVTLILSMIMDKLMNYIIREANINKNNGC